MEFKGTKGKWVIKGDNNINVGKKLIACAYGFDVKKEYVYTNETKANALLISKAPEMLNALIEIERCFSLTENVRENLRKLIEEATKID